MTWLQWLSQLAPDRDLGDDDWLMGLAVDSGLVSEC